MPIVSRAVRFQKILTFSINEGMLAKLKNRLGMILGRKSLL
ncbi:hypothetical protein E2C01_045532 [Portunus trituberculatus]|uniref:Uncharacterized protein n=1 Tax=Portunus trituberculatus TaxID=210409 RepID=A0A5B7FW12_PORTR|nr:hypothetical protein [Portunus trituberculatus]